MREFKFRGKCKQSGDIVYGDLIHGVGAKNGQVSILPLKTNLAYVKHCDPLDGVIVDSETVGQFTGLRDRNGNEIYEGDVVKAAYAPRYELNTFLVKYDTCAFVCYRKHDNPSVQFEQLPLSPSNSMEDLEIIGNIYENPELLTGQELKQKQS